MVGPLMPTVRQLGHVRPMTRMCVIDDRDVLRSTVLGSQIAANKWHDYLGDPTIAIADPSFPAPTRLCQKGRPGAPARRKGSNSKKTR